MPCTAPLDVWQQASSGAVLFKKPLDKPAYPITIACGQCIDCRLKKATDWQTRIIHEAKMHDENCFITLTYDDEHLPYGGSLDKTHLQKFKKRLRDKIAPTKIRTFDAGEYGDQKGRPHYHSIIFGWNPRDRELVRESKKGGKILRDYTSETLTKIWGMGKTEVADFTTQTAGYIARYAIKKVTGDRKQEHYERLVTTTGEIIQAEPEFITMSSRPGIGRKWIEKYVTDVYPWDEVIIDGKPRPVPKYYDDYFEKINPEEMERIKIERVIYAKEHAENYTEDRLRSRAIIQSQKVKNQLRRTLK
jgi:hypothetical protein